MARLSERQLKAINDNPINNSLDHVRATVQSSYRDADVQGPLVKFERLISDSVGRALVLKLIVTLLNLLAATTMPSVNGDGMLLNDLFSLIHGISSNAFDIGYAAELIKLSTHYPTTPPQSSAPFVTSVQQTPWSFNTGSLVDTSDLRRDLDPILKDELESNLIIDHPEFFNKFFDGVPRQGEIAAAVFEICKEAEAPLYKEGTGWVGWPEDCKESRVLHWLGQRINQFLQFANERGFQPPTRRRYFTTPNKPIPGSVSKRKLDVGIVYNQTNEASLENTNDDLLCDWSDVLVPGELKGDPREDNHSSTWLDLSRYAREIFSAEDTRRSVIGFTLCGPIMRLWELDRLGGVASPSFNIHEDGLMFISSILGFLWMTEKELGFDPTIHKSKGGRYIEITLDGQPEQLHLDEVIKRQRCVVGRATTCWKAYRDRDKSKSAFAVKDSWEDEERPEEGLLLKKVTEAGVENVVEYYYHETVCDRGAIVDIRNNVRKGLRDEVGKYPFQRVYLNSHK
ncbi:hypothetical protein BJ875DRAFT_494545 [Amylocarpus encephaloides]|uniref:Fungal-type protein kinase domain-containing protein n=1 Tax=Amylocarpus encephaloides TaxID=45428 RepID=A0A9P7YLR3_9HELO|nr:hypothetical protein BJ875DRAFT_494545 [Amylocarpus encephaloides]